MRYLKATIRYGIYAILLPLIAMAILSTFVIVALDWYAEKMQWLVEQVGEVLA